MSMAVKRGRPPGISNLNRNGRTRGSKNKYGQIKRDMLWVYKELGGRREMLKWAKDRNTQEVFYRELLRLLPKELDLETPAGNIRLVMDIEEKEPDAENTPGDDQVQGEQDLSGVS